MKSSRRRLYGGALALSFLVLGCYESGAMSVTSREFFATNPKFKAPEELPPPDKANTMEQLPDPNAATAANPAK